MLLRYICLMDEKQIDDFHKFLKRYYHTDIVELSAALAQNQTPSLTHYYINIMNDSRSVFSIVEPNYQSLRIPTEPLYFPLQL